LEDRASTFSMSERFDLDWFQAFGLRLWYSIADDEPIEDAVFKFHHDLIHENEPAFPTPWRMEESRGNLSGTSNNVSKLWNDMTPQPAFGTQLAAAPNDWSIGITWIPESTGTYFKTPYSLAIDVNGSVWIQSYGAKYVFELDNAGNMLSPADGFQPPVEFPLDSWGRGSVAGKLLGRPFTLLDWGQDGHNALSNMLDCFRRQLRIHWQRQNPLCLRFGDGEVSSLVPQILVCWLQMNRNRIMNPRTDAPVGQALSEHVAIFSANHIEMPG